MYNRNVRDAKCGDCLRYDYVDDTTDVKKSMFLLIDAIEDTDNYNIKRFKGKSITTNYDESGDFKFIEDDVILFDLNCKGLCDNTVVTDRLEILTKYTYYHEALVTKFLYGYHIDFIKNSIGKWISIHDTFGNCNDEWLMMLVDGVIDRDNYIIVKSIASIALRNNSDKPLSITVNDTHTIQTSRFPYMEIKELSRNDVEKHIHRFSHMIIENEKMKNETKKQS